MASGTKGAYHAHGGWLLDEKNFKEFAARGVGQTQGAWLWYCKVVGVSLMVMEGAWQCDVQDYRSIGDVRGVG